MPRRAPRRNSAAAAGEPDRRELYRLRRMARAHWVSVATTSGFDPSRYSVNKALETRRCEPSVGKQRLDLAHHRLQARAKLRARLPLPFYGFLVPITRAGVDDGLLMQLDHPFGAGPVQPNFGGDFRELIGHRAGFEAEAFNIKRRAGPSIMTIMIVATISMIATIAQRLEPVFSCRCAGRRWRRSGRRGNASVHHTTRTIQPALRRAVNRFRSRAISASISSEGEIDRR
jgi:hypothetical protein